MRWRDALSFLLVGAALAGTAWFGYRTVGEWRRGSDIAQDIGSLEATNRSLETENASLTDRIGYLKTDNFREQEGKRKFNYQRVGEQVVVIQPAPSVAAAPAPESVAAAEVSFPRPVYRAWWEYFFGPSL